MIEKMPRPYDFTNELLKILKEELTFILSKLFQNIEKNGILTKLVFWITITLTLKAKTHNTQEKDKPAPSVSADAKALAIGVQRYKCKYTSHTSQSNGIHSIATRVLSHLKTTKHHKSHQQKEGENEGPLHRQRKNVITFSILPWFKKNLTNWPYHS